MPKDVLITPASGLIDFKDTAGASDASIQLDDSGNLIITNAGGILSIGNTAANLYIGDGTNSVDIIFEQSGKIRALTNKTLTLGQSDSFVSIASPTTFLSPDGTKSITARMLNTDVLSFQGGAGELLSLSDSMTGTIYSVNDVSGIPSIEVLDTGVIKLGQYSGNVLIGTGTDNGTDKLQINGNISCTSINSSALGSGTTNATKFLRGDRTWSAPEYNFTLRQPDALQVYTGVDRWYAPANLTITSVVARLETAADATVTVVIKKTSGGTVTSTTIQIPANTTKVTITPSISMVVDDYLTVDVTTIGTTAKGAGLTLNFKYTQS